MKMSIFEAGQFRISLVSSLILMILTAFSSPSKQITKNSNPGILYTLTIKEDSPLRLYVSINITSSFDTLSFFGPSVGIEPEEWRNYVSNVEALKSNGEKLKLEESGAGEWVLASDYNQHVTIDYEIDMSFALDSWPAGNEHAAFYTDSTLYAVGEALFMTPNSFSLASVTFNLPDNWKVTTPYVPTSDDNKFNVNSEAELLDNCIILGHHGTYIREDGEFRYLLAMIGPLAEQKDLISKTVDKVLNQYFSLFGGAPESTYLQAMFLSDEEDGEAFLQSSGFRTSLFPTEEHLILWGNQLAHEVFHKWLSSDGIIHPTNYGDSQWFSEGFSEYYANVSLLRSGAFQLDDFIKKMEKNIGLYLYWGWSPAFKEMTLRKAGNEKWFHRLAVYNGGWTAAFCLDVHIRAETKGRKSLDDVMLALYDKFGKTDTPYRFSDLPNIVETSTGVNADDFFDKYIDGENFMPVEDYIRKAGFEAGIKGYAGEIYIWPSTDTTPIQETIHGGIIFSK